MKLLREYIRQVLCEGKLSGRTIKGVLDLLDGYSNNTWIFFDTETTGLHPGAAQLTEIGAIAVDPREWESTSQVLGEFSEKIKFTPETERLMNEPESPERVAWEKKNAASKRPMEDPQAILSMTRYGEKDREYGDEQEILDEFFEFVDSFPNPLLVAQNASFDLKFLSVRSGGGLKRYPALDTRELMDLYLLPLLRTQTQAEEGDPEAQALLDKLYVNKGNWGYHSVSMGVVSKAYDISIDDWHNALADVKMMMEMYQKIVQTIQRGLGIDISKQHARAIKLQKKRRKRKQ